MRVLIELYLKLIPSGLTVEQLEQDLAWLAENEWSAESIFFSINYCSKFYQSELKASLKNCLVAKREELIKFYEIAKAKQARDVRKEESETVDQRNDFQGAYTPSWFRKSFDKRLFE